MENVWKPVIKKGYIKELIIIHHFMYIILCRRQMKSLRQFLRQLPFAAGNSEELL